jgi:hypothetical protein
MALALLVLLGTQTALRPTHAVPLPPVASPAAVNVGSNSSVTITVDNQTQDVVFSWSGPATRVTANPRLEGASGGECLGTGTGNSVTFPLSTAPGPGCGGFTAGEELSGVVVLRCTAGGHVALSVTQGGDEEIGTLQCVVPTPTPGPTPTPTVRPPQPADALAAVVVTAQPNVVVCGGTSLISASGRDANGHVIPGLGFHFSVDSGGILVGPPRTADAVQSSAILTILPGMSTATVLVSVGDEIGDIKGQVTVQQFCPSYQETPGVVTLTASAPRIHCGGTVFVAATVKDVTGNFAPDGMPIEFIANMGTVNPARAVTDGGRLNVRYTAPSNAGIATITAAGGAAFGKIDITVDCPVAPGAPGAAPPQVVCIGEGICIIPPSTGNGGLVKKTSR